MKVVSETEDVKSVNEDVNKEDSNEKCKCEKRDKENEELKNRENVKTLCGEFMENNDGL